MGKVCAHMSNGRVAADAWHVFGDGLFDAWVHDEPPSDDIMLRGLSDIDHTHF
jgi:hypothetical protein